MLCQKKTSLHKKIARIAKRCPENITSVVKCVKLLFPKVLRIFFYSIDSSDSSKKVHATSPHLTTDVILSGQRFAIPTMFHNDTFFQAFAKFSILSHVSNRHCQLTFLCTSN